MARPDMPVQIEEGEYKVRLVDIISADNEGNPLTRKGLKNGGMERYQDWKFMVMGGDKDEEIIQVRTSLKYSPKGENPASKAYLYTQALMGGTAPPITEIDFDDLIGKEAIAIIEVNEKGYSNIEKLKPLKPAAAKPRAAAPPPPPSDEAELVDSPF